ncbi:two-component system, NarL family, sensor histidine kinase DesK [Arsukibacterium tuosuense]|uniref:Two-component system, NarL family, sensor histidine kinase DesK n=1 Tax=Arsukibacterium tuosuense TaxID=1323745 RepID=A0A285IM48_9GAMM|nr:sensor histidine kinase [Arsukibacterium tuosuense]SNY49075.1 two-component system, NarL family, sensor histidine kinase DesK [Arsukibacterium tuosuense]
MNTQLERKMSWVYLINLIFYIIPLFTVSFAPWQYLSMLTALLLFLGCYFWAYRCNRHTMHWPIAGIVLVAALITPVNPGSVSMFAYAGFFIGFAYSLRRYLLLMALLTGLMVLLEITLTIHWNLFLVMGIPIVLAVSFLGRAEQTKQRHYLAEQQSEDEIKQLAAMVERERIGRDLHDILGHTLSSVILKADLATKLLAHQQTEPAQQQLAELSQIARDALSQVRQSVSGYKHQGLTAEVAKLLGRLRDAGFQAALKGEIPVLSNRRETAVILALTELVTNVMRHSKGDSCQLQFLQQDNNLHICLSDNGPATAINEGNGITGLRERLAAIGATLALQQHHGVTATIQLPLQEQTL